MFFRLNVANLFACLVICCLSLSCLALAADEIYGQTENFLRAFSSKCAQKPLPGETVRRALKFCIEKNLVQATSTIPESLYPVKFRELLNNCINTSVSNFCSPAALGNARSCLIRNGISSLPELRRVYEQHREEIIKLGNRISNDCSSAIRAL